MNSLKNLTNVKTVRFALGNGDHYEFEKTHDVSSFDMNKYDIRLLIQDLDMKGNLRKGLIQRAIEGNKDILLENFNMIKKSDHVILEELIKSNQGTTFYLELNNRSR